MVGDRRDRTSVRDNSHDILALDPEHTGAYAFLAAATRALASGSSEPQTVPIPPSTLSQQPTSFANGRYRVKKFLGEGGKKKVDLAQDTLLDREVAFALIKTEGLADAIGQR